jgi:hypothetical protein
MMPNSAVPAAPEKRQPWKVFWPPTDQQLEQPFTGLGFKKDQKIVMDGTSVFPSAATSEDEKATVLAVAK